MDYVLLSPDEVGALLNLSRDDVVGLVETGELAGLRIAGHWRVPLKSVAQMLASGLREQNVRALERVFNDHDAWHRVFGAHPEVTMAIEAGAFPVGSVGAYLKEAIGITRDQQSGQVGPGGRNGRDQDAAYDGDEDGTRHRA
jgi:excisionase family DNA binding protein